ncbi:hypothetical protein PC128_g27433 [Phytophthora cactorum]|nr:hypothetical protein PC128_g27433 [Phytophthora cactorum]
MGINVALSDWLKQLRPKSITLHFAINRPHPFVWNETFDEYVCSIGFQVSAFDPCLYVKIVDGHCVLVLVYVDDVLITGSSPELIARTKTDLKTRFEMTDSGKCAFVLGIELVDGPDGSVTMCQQRYVDDILKHFAMDECKAVMEGMDLGHRSLDEADGGSTLGETGVEAGNHLRGRGKIRK